MSPNQPTREEQSYPLWAMMVLTGMSLSGLLTGIALFIIASVKGQGIPGLALLGCFIAGPGFIALLTALIARVVHAPL